MKKECTPRENPGYAYVWWRHIGPLTALNKIVLDFRYVAPFLNQTPLKAKFCTSRVKIREEWAKSPSKYLDESFVLLMHIRHSDVLLCFG